MEWQPIETAPIEPFNKEKWFMDGTKVLLWVQAYCTIGSYNYTQTGKGRWQNYLGNINPTHWMPLPTPPESKDW